MRRYVRSTRAHNTAMVDGCEQSEIWGAFRVARRARPDGAVVQKLGESKARFSGSHDGFGRLPGQPLHPRTIEYEATGVWTVVDTFSGRGEHRVESFVHLHPDLMARRVGIHDFRCLACKRPCIGDGSARCFRDRSREGMVLPGIRYKTRKHRDKVSFVRTPSSQSAVPDRKTRRYAIGAPQESAHLE